METMTSSAGGSDRDVVGPAAGKNCHDPSSHPGVAGTIADKSCCASFFQL